MDECLVIIMIFNFFFKNWHRFGNINKKFEIIRTIKFFNTGHRFRVSEKWEKMEGKLKFGFAQGRVQTIVLSMPIGKLIPSPGVDVQFGQDQSFFWAPFSCYIVDFFSRISTPLIATWDPRPANRN